MIDLRDEIREIRIVEYDSGIRYQSFAEYQYNNRSPVKDFIVKIAFFTAWLIVEFILIYIMYILFYDR